MSLISRLSIRNKLNLIILLTSSLLLLFVGSLLLCAQYYGSRAALARQVQALAASLTATAEPLLVLEKRAELVALLATLQRQTNVQAAYLFDAEGTPLAEYFDADRAPFVIASVAQDRPLLLQPVRLATQTFSSGHLTSRYPIHYSAELVGSLYLLSALDPIYFQLKTVVAIIFVSLVLLLLCVWWLSRFLQKPLTDPLMQLEALMQRVSDEDNLSLRAPRLSEDETGILSDGFNRMLTRIEGQQQHLEQYQLQLEEKVAERTESLRSALAEIRLAKDEAELATQAKSAFLARMTHELRSPMIGVLGMNELLQRTGLDEQQRLLTDTVQRSGNELLKLINEILDLSRIEAGKVELNSAPVRLDRLAEELGTLFVPRAAAKGLALQLSVAGVAQIVVNVDEGRIRQILTNLVTNAIKFTAQGQIAVEVALLSRDQAGGLFSFKVADSGCGMDEEVAGKIFDVFYQAQPGGSKGEPGTGLGLTIVRELVRLMNGRIDFDSSPGQGSTFAVELRLPIVAEAAENVCDSVALPTQERATGGLL